MARDAPNARSRWVSRLIVLAGLFLIAICLNFVVSAAIAFFVRDYPGTQEVRITENGEYVVFSKSRFGSEVVSPMSSYRYQRMRRAGVGSQQNSKRVDIETVRQSSWDWSMWRSSAWTFDDYDRMPELEEARGFPFRSFRLWVDRRDKTVLRGGFAASEEMVKIGWDVVVEAWLGGDDATAQASTAWISTTWDRVSKIRIPLIPIWWGLLFNAVIYAGVLMALRWLVLFVVGFLRRTRGRCGACSYDLAGLGSGRCPECGRGFVRVTRVGWVLLNRRSVRGGDDAADLSWIRRSALKGLFAAGFVGAAFALNVFVCVVLAVGVRNYDRVETVTARTSSDRVIASKARFGSEMVWLVTSPRAEVNSERPRGSWSRMRTGDWTLLAKAPRVEEARGFPFKCFRLELGEWDSVGRRGVTGGMVWGSGMADIVWPSRVGRTMQFHEIRIPMIPIWSGMILNLAIYAVLLMLLWGVFVRRCALFGPARASRDLD